MSIQVSDYTDTDNETPQQRIFTQKDTETDPNTNKLALVEPRMLRTKHGSITLGKFQLNYAISALNYNYTHCIRNRELQLLLQTVINYK